MIISGIPYDIIRVTEYEYSYTNGFGFLLSMIISRIF